MKGERSTVVRSSTRSTSENCWNECVVCVGSVGNRRRVENNNQVEMKEKQREEDEMWSVCLLVEKVGYSMPQSSHRPPLSPFCLFTPRDERILFPSLPLAPLLQLENTKRVSSLPRDHPYPSSSPQLDARSPSFDHLVPLRPGCPYETPPHPNPYLDTPAHLFGNSTKTVPAIPAILALVLFRL